MLPVFIFILLAACQPSYAAGTRPDTENPGNLSWADSTLKNMSLDEKIGQLFMIAAYSNRNEKYEKDLIYIINKYRVGGVCFFRGGPERQAALINRIQKNAKIPGRP